VFASNYSIAENKVMSSKKAKKSNLILGKKCSNVALAVRGSGHPHVSIRTRVHLDTSNLAGASRARVSLGAMTYFSMIVF
jgi:hypothetical protein